MLVRLKGSTDIGITSFAVCSELSLFYFGLKYLALLEALFVREAGLTSADFARFLFSFDWC